MYTTTRKFAVAVVSALMCLGIGVAATAPASAATTTQTVQTGRVNGI